MSTSSSSTSKRRVILPASVMQYFTRWPLWLQVNSAMVALTFTVAFLVGLYVKDEESAYYYNEIQSEGEKLLSVLGATSLDALITRDQVALDSIIYEARRSAEDIKGITIRGPEAQVLAQWQAQYTRPEDVIMIRKEVFAENEKFGSIDLSLSLEHRMAEISHHISGVQWSIFLSLMTLSVLVTTMFHRLAVSPINQINKRLLTLANGEYSGRLELTTSEEICRLGRSINTLSEAMEAESNSANRSHEILEEKVKARTAELEKLYEQMKYQALHDSLTGLPNRLLLNDRLQHVLIRAKRYGVEVALLFIDLNRFKNINDSYGHVAGDSLIKEVAHRLSSNLRAEDTVARLAGDEFVCILYDTKTRSDILHIVEKLLSRIAHPVNLGAVEIEPRASIGISVFPHDGESGADLLKHADVAMYHAKNALHKDYAFFNSSIGSMSSKRLLLIQDIINVIRDGDLRVQYQIIKNIETNECAGAEALVRWQHPEFGEIGPDEFVPLAEELGMIHEIDLWVLETACRELAVLCEKRDKRYFLSVNFSSHTFQVPGLIERIQACLDGVDSSLPVIQIEITENTYLQNMDVVIDNIRKLKTLGFRIAIDDFGSGYASFSYLARLPVDTLKIDKQFMHKVTSNDNSHTIAQAIINLGNKLGLTVIAEGVENQDQENFLVQQKCFNAQGYLYGRPGDLRELAME